MSSRIHQRLAVLAIAGAIGASTPETAHAFTVASGFTEGCHERISVRAYLDYAVALPVSGLYVPSTEDDETWREVSAFFADQFGDLGTTVTDPNDFDEADAFLLTSLLIGVRSPDTEGHSTLNLSALRQLHSDPSPEGQYAHALRAPEDDHGEGDVAAVAGTRRRIALLMADAVAALAREDERQLTMGVFYLDFYGRIDVPVSASAYYLGQAAHAVQDSFSHAIRDEASGFREILSVLNYVDAIGTRHDETRDGLAHSDSMDDCFGVPGEAGGTVDAAVAATVDLFIAFRTLGAGTDPDVLDRFFAKWFVYREGCSTADGFCGNDRWLDTVRAAQTGPYFEEIFGCSTSVTAAAPGWPAVGVVVVLAMAVVASARWRVGRRCMPRQSG